MLHYVGLCMHEFQDIAVVWLLYRCIAAGFAPIHWLPSIWSLYSSDSFRAGTEIGLLIIY